MLWTKSTTDNWTMKLKKSFTIMQ